MSEVCARGKESLKEAGGLLHALETLISEQADLKKIDAYAKRAEDALDSVGEDIIELDNIVGNLSEKLNSLQKQYKQTSVDTGRKRHKKTLIRRYKMYKKKFEYYCHMRLALLHQIETQKLANDLLSMGIEYGDQDELDFNDQGRKAVIAGPHIRKLLSDYTDEN